MLDADDDQLHKKARRRLIGAVVFVSLATVALLAAMDSEPPDTPVPTLVIPSEDGRLEAFPLDSGLALTQPAQPDPALAPQIATPTATTPQATPQAAPAPADPPPVPPVPVRVEPPKAEPPKAEPKPAVTAPPPAAVTPRPAPALTPPAANRLPVENPALQDANRAAAILAGRSPETANSGAPRPAANTTYVVQVIASNNAETIRDTVEKLRALGLPVYTEKATGDMTRVRVGPYTTPTDAERAAGRIHQDGKITGAKIYPTPPR